MAGIIIPTAHAAITAATSAGYVTVADATLFHVGAHVWIANSSGAAQVFCTITEKASNVLGISIKARQPTLDNAAPQTNPKITGPNYGRSDMSSYNGGTIDQDVQFVYNRNDNAAT